MTFQILVQIFESIFTSLAIIIGGYWTYRLYKTKREAIWNLKIDVNHNISQYKDKKIIVFEIILKNNGKIKITPSILNLNIQYLPNKMEVNNSYHWDSNRETFNHNILTDSNHEIKSALINNIAMEELYNIEPDGEYIECALFIVEPDNNIIAEIEFRNKENNESFYTYKIINIPPLKLT